MGKLETRLGAISRAAELVMLWGEQYGGPPGYPLPVALWEGPAAGNWPERMTLDDVTRWVSGDKSRRVEIAPTLLLEELAPGLWHPEDCRHMLHHVSPLFWTEIQKLYPSGDLTCVGPSQYTAWLEAGLSPGMEEPYMSLELFRRLLTHREWRVAPSPRELGQKALDWLRSRRGQLWPKRLLEEDGVLRVGEQVVMRDSRDFEGLEAWLGVDLAQPCSYLLDRLEDRMGNAQIHLTIPLLLWFVQSQSSPVRLPMELPLTPSVRNLHWFSDACTPHQDARPVPCLPLHEELPPTAYWQNHGRYYRHLVAT